MSISAQLIEEYNTKLMADANVRALVAAVAQDPQNETVDLSASRASVRSAVVDDHGKARRAIIGWLNKLYFSQLDNVIPFAFWYEMHTRIQKLLVVSMILEGDNLRSFGAIPETSDIPQCLVFLQRELIVHRHRDFGGAKKDFEKAVDVLKKDDDFGKWYLALYTN